LLQFGLGAWASIFKPNIRRVVDASMMNPFAPDPLLELAALRRFPIA